MDRNVLRIIGLVFFLLSNCWALYPPNSNVIELTPNNFDKLVINSDEVWIVEFFAHWCGHCQQLVPEYQKAANTLKGVVKVGAVNAEEHNAFSGRFGIRGFPTIKIFGLNKNKPDDYTGERTAQALVNAVMSTIRNKVSAKLGGKAGRSGSKVFIELLFEFTYCKSNYFSDFRFERYN